MMTLYQYTVKAFVYKEELFKGANYYIDGHKKWFSSIIKINTFQSLCDFWV